MTRRDNRGGELENDMSKAEAVCVVALEVAENEFDRLCALSRVSTDAADMTEEEAATFAELRKKLVRAIMRGSLVVDASGVATYQPPVAGSKAFAFKNLMASALIGSNGKQQDQMSKTLQIIAAMTERTPAEVARLAIPDLKMCGSLVTLFMAAE